MNDIYGNPIFTWENLILYIIYVIVLFCSLSIRFYFISLPSRKRNKEIIKKQKIKKNLEIVRELYKNKIC